MIVTEQLNERLVKIYSDEGVLIQRVDTGVLYEEVIDPIDAGRTYRETDIPIKVEGDEADAEAVDN